MLNNNKGISKQFGDDEKWRLALVLETAVLQEAVLSMNRSALQIVLIVTSEGKLVGSITDGDIRRGLLRGITLQDCVDMVMFRHPLVVPSDFGPEAVLQIMSTNKIHQLPIVDINRNVVGLHLWENLKSYGNRRDNVIVIMAGGTGTRLRPYTNDCPKPLLRVGDKPIMHHIIERAKSEGFYKFLISINYLGKMIEDYFGDGSKFHVEISYLREEEPLGTAGALSLLKGVSGAPYLITNGDVLTDLRYGELIEFHEEHNSFATMAVRQYEWQNPFGVVHLSGIEMIRFEEKPIYRTHINAGIYVLSPQVFEFLNPNEKCDMPTFLQRLKHNSLKTIVYPMHESWVDIGRPQDLHSAQKII